MPPSTSGHQSISGVFAESYSPVASPSRHSPSPQSSLDGRSVHDELLSPRQAPTPEMAGPFMSSTTGRLSGVDSPMLTRNGLDEGHAVTSGARRGVTDEDRRGSTLVARTPRVPASNGFDDRAQGTGSSARATKEQGGHLRRRSSMSNMQTSLLMDDVDISRTAKTTPGSTGMERAASLTTFMKTGGGFGATRAAEVNDRAKAKRAEREAQGVRLPIPRRKLYSALLKLSLLVSLSACVFYIAEYVYAFFRAPPLDDIDAESSRTLWLQRLQDKSLLFDTLETVPYPVKTHPRSPRAEEKATLSLADYLLTRLGSHFSFPSKNLYDDERGSQLWLTTATADSVELANRHLVTFFQSLSDADPDSPLLSPPDPNSSNSSFPLQNANQWRTRRAVITLCRDIGCMEYCRKNPRLFCYNGFVPHRNPRDPLDKAGLHAQNADEIAKLRGILETLETGRRVFWVDSGTYLRRDPVPYMGDLASYDLQIPDGWSTGNTDAGIAVFNPSQRVISLVEKMLEIARLPLVRDRNTWASTNLLLDPSGEHRNYEMMAPRHAAALDENLYDDDPDQKGNGGYGQTEFESSWDGGLDVRVLDSRYFHSSTGRLGRRRFKHEQQKSDDLLYFHCVCCGDPYQQDYIAGALGYHQAMISYNLTDAASRPVIPLVLKAVELKGTARELRQAMSLLLQITAATGRTFVPPLTVTLVEPDGEERELYIWRAFPIALWAHPNLARLSRLPDRVKLPPTENLEIKEPAFVMHAAEHLLITLPDQSTAARLAAELRETLTLDLGDGELTSLQVLIDRLKRPFWSTERTIALENFEAIRDKEAWRVADDYADVTMCDLEARPADEGGKTCGQLCPL